MSSRFDNALDFVRRELDRRREAGYADWRASAGAVDRLRAARPRGPAALPVNAPAPAAAPANETLLTPPTLPMPKRDEPDALSLFGEQEVPPAAAKPKAKTGSDTPGVYDPVTDPAQPKTERLGTLRACLDGSPT